MKYKGFTIEVRKSEKGNWLARGIDVSGEEAFPIPHSSRDRDRAIEGVKMLIDVAVFKREQALKADPESEWHSPDS